MIVYNVTMNVDPPIEAEWLRWLQQEHIPGMMNTGLFLDYKLYRLLNEQQEDGITYIVQYFSASIEHYSTYINEFSQSLRQHALDKWGNQFIAFRTIMQSVD